MFGLLSSPPFLLQLPLLILPILTASCLAWQNCDPFVQGRAPLPRDCRYVLRHLPTANDLPNPHVVFDPSSPFLPPAEFRHGNCAIVLNVFNSTDYPRPPLRLTAADALEVWTYMWLDVARLIMWCVDMGQTGSTRRDAIRGADPDVSVTVYVGPAGLFDYWWMDQRRVMQGLAPLDEGQIDFGMTIYEV